MLLPYASDRPPQNPPLAVVVLVLIQFVVFGMLALAVSARPESVIALYANLALVPAGLHWYSPLTYSFLHEGVFHLSANMLFLWVFGGSVEDAIGWRRLLVLYLAAAVATGLVQVGMAWVVPGADRWTPIVGASGAVSALVGVFAVRFYRSRIRLLGLPFRMPAVVLLTVVLVGEMAFTVWGLLHRGSAGPGQPVAHWSHIAGFVLGLLWGQASRMAQAGRREYMATDAAADMERGAPLSAARRWQAVLAEEPGNLRARSELARAWGATGDREQCVDNYQQAIAGYLQQGKRRQAADAYAELTGFYPDVVLPAADQMTVARSLEQHRRYKEAEAAFASLAREHPDAPEAEMAQLRMGVLLLKHLHEPAAARKALAGFVEQYPTSEWRRYAEDLLREADGRPTRE